MSQDTLTPLLTDVPGLSLLFFILSLMGNLTYGAGVRTIPELSI